MQITSTNGHMAAMTLAKPGIDPRSHSGARASTGLARAFDEEVRAAFSVVLCRHSYIDTVQILCASMDDMPLRRALQERGIPFILRAVRHPEWLYAYRFHQPPIELLQHLDKTLCHYLVNRFDVAHDYICETNEAARGLHAFIAQHLSQPWHGKRQSRVIDAETVYLAEAWKGRNIAAYATRPSKVDGQPCAHIEARLFTVKQVRRWNAERLPGLIQVDLATVLNKEARLSKLNRAHLERSVEALVQSSMKNWKEAGIEMDSIAEVRQKVHTIMARALGNSEEGVHPNKIFDASVQAWLETAPHLVRRGVIHVPFPLIK